MKPKYDLTIYTDGGARGNPGPAAYGFVIYNSSNKIMFEEGRVIGVSTNNVAEYSGVVAALRQVLSSKYQVGRINFLMDSKLVVEQMLGRWKIKNENLRNLFFTIKDLQQKIGGEITYRHVPREQNKKADFLVNAALDGEI